MLHLISHSHPATPQPQLHFAHHRCCCSPIEACKNPLSLSKFSGCRFTSSPPSSQLSAADNSLAITSYYRGVLSLALCAPTDPILAFSLLFRHHAGLCRIVTLLVSSSRVDCKSHGMYLVAPKQEMKSGWQWSTVALTFPSKR